MTKTKYIVIIPDDEYFDVRGRPAVVSQSEISEKWISLYISTTASRLDACVDRTQRIKSFLEEKKALYERTEETKN